MSEIKAVNCRICLVNMYRPPENGTIAHWQTNHPKEYLEGMQSQIKHRGDRDGDK